jgi:AP-1 complex subunit mu
VKSNYKEKSTANNVEIFVPVPEDVENPVFKMATGSVAYVPENGAFKWSIKSFPGHR